MDSILYSEMQEDPSIRPLPFLVERLPGLRPGRALDLAMGEGRNAVYLAEKGYAVDGVDRSEGSVRKAMGLARIREVSLHGVVADLEDYRIPPQSYDLICCFFYLARPMFADIQAALRPGGALIYQSVTTDETRINPDFPQEWCLEPNELLHAFPALRVIYYRESDPEDGRSHSALASLVALAPA